MPEAGVVFFGSGSLGVPTLSALHARGVVRVVISQPDRPAGRGLKETPTPVSTWAVDHGVALVRTKNTNEGEALYAAQNIDGPLVVIAFGQKLMPQLLMDRSTVNLHPSDLPRWRGAAPIQRAMMAGESRVGVCAMRVADRMDAGDVLDRFHVEIGEWETASEVLDRVAVESVPMMVRVVEQLLVGTMQGVAQNGEQATYAAKLDRSEASVSFAHPADRVRLRINGLQPWPGCVVRVQGQQVRLLRVKSGVLSGSVGSVLADGSIGCSQKSILPMLVQSPGGRAIEWDAWRHGQRGLQGAHVESDFPADTPP